MKIPSVIFAIAVLILVETGFAQSFQNLGFESATVPPGSFAQAFPGWTGYIGGVQQSSVLYNLSYSDTAGISILDQGWTNSPGYAVVTHGGVIQGHFTALLMSGIAPGAGVPADTSIAQTGLVPIGTQTLQFKAYMDYIGLSGSFGVTLGGQTLSLTPLQSGSNYTLYGADISQWSGQSAQLAFTVFAQRPHIGDTYFYLDSIDFSTQPIPEPSGWALLCIGTLLLGFFRRRDTSR